MCAAPKNYIKSSPEIVDTKIANTDLHNARKNGKL